MPPQRPFQITPIKTARRPSFIGEQAIIRLADDISNNFGKLANSFFADAMKDAEREGSLAGQNAISVGPDGSVERNPIPDAGSVFTNAFMQAQRIADVKGTRLHIANQAREIADSLKYDPNRNEKGIKEFNAIRQTVLNTVPADIRGQVELDLAEILPQYQRNLEQITATELHAQLKQDTGIQIQVDSDKIAETARVGAGVNVTRKEIDWDAPGDDWTAVMDDPLSRKISFNAELSKQIVDHYNQLKTALDARLITFERFQRDVNTLQQNIGIAALNGQLEGIPALSPDFYKVTDNFLKGNIPYEFKNLSKKDIGKLGKMGGTLDLNVDERQAIVNEVIKLEKEKLTALNQAETRYNKQQTRNVTALKASITELENTEGRVLTDTEIQAMADKLGVDVTHPSSALALVELFKTKKSNRIKRIIDDALTGTKLTKEFSYDTLAKLKRLAQPYPEVLAKINTAFVKHIKEREKENNKLSAKVLESRIIEQINIGKIGFNEITSRHHMALTKAGFARLGKRRVGTADVLGGGETKGTDTIETKLNEEDKIWLDSEKIKKFRGMVGLSQAKAMGFPSVKDYQNANENYNNPSASVSPTGRKNKAKIFFGKGYNNSGNIFGNTELQDSNLRFVQEHKIVNPKVWEKAFENNGAILYNPSQFVEFYRFLMKAGMKDNKSILNLRANFGTEIANRFQELLKYMEQHSNPQSLDPTKEESMEPIKRFMEKLDNASIDEDLKKTLDKNIAAISKLTQFYREQNQANLWSLVSGSDSEFEGMLVDTLGLSTWSSGNIQLKDNYKKQIDQSAINYLKSGYTPEEAIRMAHNDFIEGKNVGLSDLVGNFQQKTDPNGEAILGQYEIAPDSAIRVNNQTITIHSPNKNMAIVIPDNPETPTNEAKTTGTVIKEFPALNKLMIAKQVIANRGLNDADQIAKHGGAIKIALENRINLIPRLDNTTTTQRFDVEILNLDGTITTSNEPIIIDQQWGKRLVRISGNLLKLYEQNNMQVPGFESIRKFLNIPERGYDVMPPSKEALARLELTKEMITKQLSSETWGFLGADLNQHVNYSDDMKKVVLANKKKTLTAPQAVMKYIITPALENVAQFQEFTDNLITDTDAINNIVEKIHLMSSNVSSEDTETVILHQNQPGFTESFDLIARQEGYTAIEKPDNRGTVIGHGSNLKYMNLEEKMFLKKNIKNGKISKSVAEKLSKMRIASVWGQLLSVRDLQFGALSPNRRAALTSMVYQLGFTGFLKFDKTLKHMVKQNWEEAADELLKSDWAKQTPNRAKEIATMLKAG